MYDRVLREIRRVLKASPGVPAKQRRRPFDLTGLNTAR
jgi:hypothetical protein